MNRKKNYYSIVFGVLASILLLLAGGCASTTGGNASSNKTVTLAFPWSPQSLDPHGSDSWEVMRSGTAETLVKLNEELKPVPWLAKEWSQEDNTTWQVKLVDGVHFHNGKQMDAQSVKDSLLRSIEKDPKVKDLLKIKEIDVKGECELSIVTTQPNVAFISHLSDPSTIIADVSSLNDKANVPALTGAFKITKFKKDEELIVERYKDYWGKTALLSEINIKFVPDGTTRLMALQSGEIDGATDIPVDNIQLLERMTQFKVLTAPSLRTHMLLFNMKSPLFHELDFRTIVDQIIPRKEIVKSVMMKQGTEAISPFPNILSFGQKTEQKAKKSIEQVMKQNHWAKDKNGEWKKQGKAFDVTMLTFPQRPELTVMAEIIQNKLLDEGIRVHIRQVENIDEELEKGKWDLSMYSMLTAHTGDPQYFLNIFYHSKSQSNVSHYASPTLDHLIEQLNQTVRETKRNELAMRAQEIIQHDVPQSFIVHPKTVFAIKKNLKGFVPHSIEYYYVTPEMNLTQ
ncbi:ABC transporter substrate-binding protein [Priestia koreensis]|uniref:ABC transporter substrate-binding protein n=1 Tax=Priestia koreensis TaxID=284581 RepID=UPI00345AEF21